MNTQTIKKLINEAKKARKGSYSPYSNYAVGAALMTDKGKIYTGANVENASFGLTICAERSAVFKAVNDGVKKIKAMALVSNTPDIPIPCGACRQVLVEFSSQDAVIVSINSEGKTQQHTLGELLPFVYVLTRKK